MLDDQLFCEDQHCATSMCHITDCLLRHSKLPHWNSSTRHQAVRRWATCSPIAPAGLLVCLPLSLYPCSESCRSSSEHMNSCCCYSCTHRVLVVYWVGTGRCCWRWLVWRLFTLVWRLWLGKTQFVDVHHVSCLHVDHQIPCALEGVLAKDTKEHYRWWEVLSWWLCNTRTFPH